MKIDETGLHAEDCDCAKCEVGLRPTPAERAAARRALALAAAARARIDARDKPKPPGTYPARFPPWYMGHAPSPRPYTDEQKAELAKMHARFRAGEKVSDDDE